MYAGQKKEILRLCLNAISTGKLDVKSLISEVVPLDEYNRIYDNMNNGSIASILSYPDNFRNKNSVEITKKHYS